MYGKVFAQYEPECSPIRELVAAAVAYSQSRSVTDFSHCAAPSHVGSNGSIIIV